ncbi:hypothetical protein GLA29479_2682 [Lysobacter antibioticus]|uniref:Uncharacterized protein n=1 Tax=Lysobacter antibioticus TaxID=84531 RepID=A0A0S2F5L9_LYSAN|nr:hypothetical protein GLA29479_2682 [Lysobacter antibioticus]ALN78769.1 hypothetical protein LA76x_0608 [Lysobacter antibioticus]
MGGMPSASRIDARGRGEGWRYRSTFDLSLCVALHVDSLSIIQSNNVNMRCSMQLTKFCDPN